MKKIVSSLLCLILAFSFVTLVGCENPANMKITAEQGAGIYLARERLANSTILSGAKNMTEPSLARTSEVRNSAGSKNKGVRLNDTVGEVLINQNGYHILDGIEGEHSNVMQYYQSYMDLIEDQATWADQNIELAKTRAIENKWSSSTSGQLLEVTENTDVVYSKESKGRYVSRTTRSDATSIYEFFSRNWKISGAYEYALYIPGERYEYVEYNASSGIEGRDLYMTISKEKGYWDMTYYLYDRTQDEVGQSVVSVNNVAIFDDIGVENRAVITYGKEDLEPLQSVRFLSRDAMNDLFLLSPTSIGINLSATNGIDKIKVPVSDQVEVKEINDTINGYSYIKLDSDMELGYLNPEIVFNNGRIMASGESEGDIIFTNGTMSVNLREEDNKYVTSAELIFRTTQNGLSYSQAFDKFAQYLQNNGVTFKGYSDDQLLQSVSNATEHIANFKNYATINGYGASNLQDFKSGVAIYKNIIDGCEAKYKSALSKPTVTTAEEESLRRIANGSLPVLPLNGSVTVNDSGVTLEATATFTDGTWFNGLPNGYEISLGFAKVDGSGKVRPETLVRLEKISDQDGEQKVELTEDQMKKHDSASSVTFTQNAKFALPQTLSVGEYKLIAFIKNESGLRVTGFVEITTNSTFEKTITEGVFEVNYGTVNGKIIASSKSKLSFIADNFSGSFTIASDLTEYLRSQIVKNGYYASGVAVLEKLNGNEYLEVNGTDAVESGEYRLKFNFKASDGNVYSAFVYYEV